MADWKETLHKAADAVSDLPEHLQEVAFKAVLREELGARNASEPAARDSGPAAEKQGTGQPHSKEPDRPEWLQRVIQGLPEPHKAADGTRPEQTVWAVTKLVEGGKEATTEEIRQTIKARLGVAPQSPGNTSTTLGRLVPKYLTREERDDGPGYIYSPTQNALEVFE